MQEDDSGFFWSIDDWQTCLSQNRYEPDLPSNSPQPPRAHEAFVVSLSANQGEWASFLQRYKV